ncbi:expressed conserved protein [Echinococcus multilocularis]|uniref:Expressed conserved protein n=1 Tax=Echinococcus multilocularis TaxID=6211 RepID=A0A068YCJ5_ECHMU|nr:expressed conserved protein [Echinococcus multilocularis]
MVVGVDRHKVLRLLRPNSKCPLNIEEYYDIDKKVGKPGFKTIDGRFNWHCTCVASYVTGSCGFYFRKFLANMDQFMRLEDPSSDFSAKLTFEQCYAELANCMKKFPAYYRPILEQFNESLSDVFDEQASFSK